MRDVLRSSVSTVIIANEFNNQQNLHNKIRGPHLRFNPGIEGSNSMLQQTTFCNIVRELNILSLSPIKIPRTSLLSKVTNFESSLIYGEEEQTEESLTEQKSPPWGDIGIHNESKLELGVINQTESNSQGVVVPMIKSRVHFLEETNEELLSNRILELSRTNKVRSALELFKSMELMGLLPSVHASNSLLSCLLRNGQLEDGLKFFESMQIQKLSTGHTYSMILKSVANSYGCDSAIELFKKWEREFELKKGFDAIVYNTMISICGKVNNWVETERIWKLIDVNGVNPTQVTYCLLVSIFVRSGQNELAIDAYKEMISNQFEAENDTMQAVIGASIKEGKWDFALSVFQDMLRYKLKPNQVSCNALINGLGKAGKVKLAFRVYGKMKSLGHSPDGYTWNALLSALYRVNRHGDALHLFESIKREEGIELNLHIYETALISCSKLGLWDKALKILWEMEGSGLVVSVLSYNLVISACETARKPKIALQVYEHMIHRKVEADIFTNLSLIRSCIWGSLWDEVEEIINSIEPDVSLYNGAIQGMCLRGKSNYANKLYMKMCENGLQPDGKTWALMLQNASKNSVRPRNRPSPRSMKKY